MYRITTILAILFCKLSSSQELQKVVCGDRAIMDQFGWSVAISGDYLIVGAPEKDKSYSLNTGAAYIFKTEPGKWKQIQKLEGSNPKANDFFGEAVAITDNYAAVGAEGEDDKKINDSQIRQGRVYVYKKDHDGLWQNSQVLELAEKGDSDYFGSQIAMNEKYIVIGAPGIKNAGTFDQGAVFIYELLSGRWKLTHIIDGSGNIKGSIPFGYGERLSLYDGELVLGDPISYQVRVYKLDNKKWRLQTSVSEESLKKINVSTERFGSSVSIFKNYMLIGDEGEFDPYERKTRPRTDSIMTYVRQSNDDYIQIDVPNIKRLRDSLKITPKEFRAKAKPVVSLEVRKSRKLGSGSVCVFKKDKSGSWVFQQQLFASDRSADMHFGNCVTMSDSIIAVGAFGDKLKKVKENNFYAGAAYIFKLNNSGRWIQDKKLVASKPDIWQKFGFSISANKKTIVVGCRLDSYDEEGKNLLQNAGSAFIYMNK